MVNEKSQVSENLLLRCTITRYAGTRSNYWKGSHLWLPSARLLVAHPPLIASWS